MRKIFEIFFVLLVIEGFLRKLVGNIYPTLMKDVILIIYALLSIKFYKISALRFNALKIYMLVILCVLLTSLLSFWFWEDQNYQIYLLGFREYIFYTPLIFLSYEYITEHKNPNIFLQYIAITSSLLGLLGALQYFNIINSTYLLPIPEHLVSRSSDYGEIQYISSIFDVPERYAVFSLLALIISVNFLIDSFNNKIYIITSALSLFSLLISARRVSFILGLISIFILALLKTSNFIKIIIYCLFFSFLLGILLIISDDKVSSIIINHTIADSVYYYGEWTYGEFERVLGSYEILSGKFGITSPGAVTSMNIPLDINIEAFWVRAFYSLGALPSILLFSSLFIIVMDMFIKFYKNKENNLSLISGVFIFELLVWNWKSGNFLVWTPLTLIFVGIGFGGFYRIKV